MGNGQPASAPEPSGMTSTRFRRSGQPLRVPPPGPGVAQQPVAPADGLRGLHVGVAGHQHVDLGPRPGRQRRRSARRGPPRAEPPRTSATGAHRWRPGRCGCGRCAACRRPGRSSRSAGARRSCGCPRRCAGEGRRRVSRNLRPQSFKPATISSRSSSVSRPACAMAFAQATEPVMSASHSRQSNGRDALKRAMKASIWPVKRPPHKCVT